MLSKYWLVFSWASEAFGMLSDSGSRSNSNTSRSSYRSHSNQSLSGSIVSLASSRNSRSSCSSVHSSDSKVSGVTCDSSVGNGSVYSHDSISKKGANPHAQTEGPERKLPLLRRHSTKYTAFHDKYWPETDVEESKAIQIKQLNDEVTVLVEQGLKRSDPYERKV